MTDETPQVNFEDISRSDLDSHNDYSYADKWEKGLSESLIRQVSGEKDEPDWILDIRLKAFATYQKLAMPSWGPDLSDLHLDEIRYFAAADQEANQKSWDDVDPKIKATFERLKIPEAERAMLAGVGAQYASEMVYHNLKEEWVEKGVIFLDFDVAIKEHPELVKKYFTKCFR